MMAGKRRTIVLALAGVVASAGVGWAAGATVKSPAQVAAERKPPKASLVTAEVDERTLSSNVVTRGAVRYGQPQGVALPGAGGGVVTRPPVKGESLREGATALEVDGRPVSVLSGAVPMYRDLGPGDTGTDVRQLEAALARMGFRPGKVDGVYDAATEGAVDAWYRSLGYRAKGPEDEERRELRTAREAVVTAEERLLQARTQLETGSKGATRADIVQAEAELRAAERAIASAQSTESLAQDKEALARLNARVAAASEDVSRSREAVAEANLRTAQANEETARTREALTRLAVETAKTREALARRGETSARADEQRDNARAAAEVRSRRSNVAGAHDSVQVARAKLAEAEAREEPPASEAELEQLRADLRRAQRSLEDAQAELAASELAAESTRLAAAGAVDRAALATKEAVVAIAQAESAVKEAQAAVVAATGAKVQAEVGVKEAKQATMQAGASTAQSTLGGKEASSAIAAAQAEIVSARDRVLVAEARLEQLKEPKDTKTLQEAVDSAKRALDGAREQLAELDGKVGITVPAGEVLFFPNLPLRVDEVKVDRGAEAKGELMTVSTSRLAIDASVPVADAKLVQVGDRVTISSNERDLEVGGVVSKVADKPGTDGADAQHVHIEVVPDEAPESLVGATVRLSVSVESTGGEVLAVPVSAVSVAADGTSRVQVVVDGDRTRSVTVEPGLAAEGLVAVRPVAGGKLAKGDRVVVGKGSRD